MSSVSVAQSAQTGTAPERTASPSPRRRDPFFDNAKFLAILLVVGGHAIEGLLDVRPAHAVYLFIYTFHMPVFIVLAGYLSRNFTFSSGKARKLITNVGVPYVILQIAYSILQWRLLGGGLHIRPLTPYWLLWFLMALFLWRLSTPVWQQLRLPVAVAAAVSLLAGMADLPNVLAVNRVLGFLPFYVLGIFLKPAHFDLLKRPLARVLAPFVLLGGLAAAFVADRHMSVVWTYRSYGNAHFHVDDLTGTLMRAGLLVASVVLAAAFLAVVPARHRWFTPLGAMTLYAYLLHGLVIRTSQFLGWYDNAWLHTPAGVATTGVAGVALALVLCLPPVRFLTRWAIEPRMDWAFTTIRRPHDPAAGRRPPPLHLTTRPADQLLAHQPAADRENQAGSDRSRSRRQ
jgi:fucose 4-O-acetylase-like acetyltransferase